MAITGRSGWSSGCGGTHATFSVAILYQEIDPMVMSGNCSDTRWEEAVNWQCCAISFLQDREHNLVSQKLTWAPFLALEEHRGSFGKLENHGPWK
jgi:hypothetical protein